MSELESGGADDDEDRLDSSEWSPEDEELFNDEADDPLDASECPCEEKDSDEEELLSDDSSLG